ncbi:MAG: CARDB domain-containing protein, partial [Candidatus Binatia bacterium]
MIRDPDCSQPGAALGVRRRVASPARRRATPRRMAFLAGATCAALAWVVPAFAAPDLVIDSIGAAPSAGANGTTVQVTATVRNQGDAAAVASIMRVRINQDSSTVLST